jgi:hypothetical protein
MKAGAMQLVIGAELSTFTILRKSIQKYTGVLKWMRFAGEFPQGEITQ